MAEKQIRRFIEPAPGYAGEIGIWVSTLEELRRQTRETVAGMTPEQLAWKPPSGGNSVGQLLRHIALVELDWVLTDLCRGVPLPKDAPAILHLDGPLADAGVRPLEIYLDALDYARKITKAKLGNYGRDEIETSREAAGGGVRKVFNVRWILFHLVNHEAQHRGQILAVQRMMKAPV